jgi:hypothetical protein
VGIKGEFSSNFDTTNTIEASGLARFILPLGGLELYAQGGIGISNIMSYDGSDIKLLYEGAIGVRITLGSFYLEPSGRYGSPFIWGAGIVFGYSLK